MSQLALSGSQHRNRGGGAGHNLRMFEIESFHLDGWQEPCDRRLSRTDLWGHGGEIPPGYPTCARHGAQHRNECCQPVSESELGSDLGVEVPWRPW